MRALSPVCLSVLCCLGYLESEVKEKEILPILEKAKAFAVDEDIKLQNFVYDQLP